MLCPKCNTIDIGKLDGKFYCFSCGQNFVDLLNPASVPQPRPTGEGEIVLNYVLEDIKSRAEMGKEKYGTYLRTYNGRDALWDCYQEAIDLVMYLRQRLLEEEN